MSIYISYKPDKESDKEKRIKDISLALKKNTRRIEIIESTNDNFCAVMRDEMIEKARKLSKESVDLLVELYHLEQGGKNESL